MRVYIYIYIYVIITTNDLFWTNRLTPRRIDGHTRAHGRTRLQTQMRMRRCADDARKEETESPRSNII